MDWKIEIYCLAFLPINYFDIYCLILVYNYCFEVCFVCFCCVYFLKSHKSINRKWARISEANICNTILIHFFVYAVLMISRKKKKFQINFLYFQKLIFICSEGGTGEDRRINPHLNFGNFIKNNNNI